MVIFTRIPFGKYARVFNDFPDRIAGNFVNDRLHIRDRETVFIFSSLPLFNISGIKALEKSEIPQQEDSITAWLTV